MRLGTWSQLCAVRGNGGRCPRRCRILPALALAGLTTAAPGAIPADAATDAAPNVIVHQDILNNLDWAAAAAARIRAKAGALATTGTALKEPPASPPVSRVLIEPERVAPLTIPSRRPAVIAESPEPPALPDADAAETAPRDPPEAGGESASPGDLSIAETLPGREAATPARPAPESPSAATDTPPAVPAPPEPTQPVTVAEDPIAAPSPPQPPPKLPETVLLAEAPPEPAPEPPVEAPAAESEPVEKPKPAATQTAARLPPALAAGELRLLFPEGSVDLTESAKEKLGALAQQLQQQAESDRRIQLQAFASSSATNASVARRLSLARALAVRTFLIEKGVRSRRIDVRALGANSGKGPPDRVDILDARS